MVPIKQDYFDYRFDPAVLREIRTKLNLSQAKLAEMLDVPPNTLSRWEIGATFPDARALAAIYSIAKNKNITPNFFKKHGNSSPKKQKTKLLLAWDFQNLGLDANCINEEWGYMKKYLDLFHSDSKGHRILRAYSSPNQRNATEILEGLNFDIREGYFDADSQLIRDSMADCQINPNKWEYIIITADGDYEHMLKDMQSMGVATYIWSSEQCSEKLRNAIDHEHFVNWDAPNVIVTCMEVIKGLKGKVISRANFGILCKKELDSQQLYPNDVGFSRKNPYGSLLRWLERRGIISITEKKGRSDSISIVMHDKP